jgi:small subunit ribosomal protein S21
VNLRMFSRRVCNDYNSLLGDAPPHDEVKRNFSSPIIGYLAIRSPERATKRVGSGIFRTGREVMSLAEVRLQEGESIENALRRFKRKVQTEDIIKEVKRHSFYLKPGAKRRVKQALARKRARKKIRKESE